MAIRFETDEEAGTLPYPDRTPVMKESCLPDAAAPTLGRGESYSFADWSVRGCEVTDAGLLAPR